MTYTLLGKTPKECIMVKTICHHCNQIINVKPCRMTKHNFCSLECKHAHGRIELICLNCKNSFIRIAFRANDIFCCKNCKSEYQTNKFTCEKCGKEFTKGKSYQGPARFCSSFCRRKQGCQGTNNCLKCGKEFSWIRSRKQVAPKFCSLECRGHTGFVPGGAIRISELTEQEKFERLKKSFEKHVIRNEDGCWGWKGSLSRGYGVMSCGPRIGPDRSHRASWVIYKGPIPKGMLVCHKCDHPECTNPEHLFLGTPSENTKDMINKNRKVVGSKVPTAKLDEEKVKEIRILLSLGKSYPKIARMFGVASGTIARIKNGETWSHVKILENT